jgi:hypothetical protein
MTTANSLQGRFQAARNVSIGANFGVSWFGMPNGEVACFVVLALLLAPVVVCVMTLIL